MATKQTTREQCEMLHQYWPNNCCLCNAQAELARLRAECEELRGSVKSKQNCLDAALEGWNKANARIERLRLTLRPFARVGEAIAEWEPDD